MNSFISPIKEYGRENNIALTIILALDNAPGHPQHIGELHPDVKSGFLAIQYDCIDTAGRSR